MTSAKGCHSEPAGEESSSSRSGLSFRAGRRGIIIVPVERALGRDDRIKSETARANTDYTDYADSLREHHRLAARPIRYRFFVVNDLGRLVRPEVVGQEKKVSTWSYACRYPGRSNPRNPCNPCSLLQFRPSSRIPAGRL